MKYNFKVNTTLIFQITLLTALFLLLFRTSFVKLLETWSTSSDYSYGFIIPIVSGYIVWLKRKDWLELPLKIIWWGLPIIVLSAIILAFGLLENHPVFRNYAIVLMIFGIVLFNCGFHFTKALLMPILFLLLMIPLPNTVEVYFTSSLQSLSSWLSVQLIRLLGISVALEGNIVDIGIIQLNIVKACSGLRYVLPLFAVGIIYAYLMEKNRWKQFILTISTIPIAVLTNALRIAAVAILIEYFGINATKGFAHSITGFLVFFTALSFLVVEHWLLSFLYKSESPHNETTNSTKQLPTNTNLQETKNLPNLSFIISSTLLLLFVGLTFVNVLAEVPRKDFATFPLRLKDWEGKRDFMDDDIFKATQADDYLLLNYKNAKTWETVNFFIAFHQRDLVVHLPSFCMPAAGWSTKKLEDISWPPVARGKVSLLVSEMYLDKQLMVFWMETRKKRYTRYYTPKWDAIFTALSGKRPCLSVVRLSTVMDKGETVEESTQRLLRFYKDFQPILDQYVP